MTGQKDSVYKKKTPVILNPPQANLIAALILRRTLYLAALAALACHTVIGAVLAPMPAAPAPASALAAVSASVPVTGGTGRYYAGAPLPGPEFAYTLIVLDNTGYSAGYCPERKGPAWVAFRASASAAYPVPPRPRHFTADPRVPDSPQPDDYTASGFDRGHLAPSRLITCCYGPDAQVETFLMTNILPQRPALNRELWARIEDLDTRDAGQPDRSVWVITGPVYGEHPRRLPGGEAVPEKFYRIDVRDSRTGAPEIQAFIVPQDVTGHETPAQFRVSVREIEQETHLLFLRGLTEPQRVAAERHVREDTRQKPKNEADLANPVAGNYCTSHWAPLFGGTGQVPPRNKQAKAEPRKLSSDPKTTFASINIPNSFTDFGIIDVRSSQPSFSLKTGTFQWNGNGTCEERAHLGAAPRLLLPFRGVPALQRRHGRGVRALLFVLIGREIIGTGGVAS